MRIILILLLVLAAGCTDSEPSSGTDPSRPTVVASFFPLAEAARAAVLGAEVRDLTPAGAEPHDLEVTSKQVDAIETADLVIVMGHDFQPAIEELAERRGDRALFVLDELDLPDDVDDPHVWLDPVLMGNVFELIRAKLDAGPTTATNELASDLRTLDAEYASGLEQCDRRRIVTAHEAFGYLAARYDLVEDAIAGIEPDQEPSANRIAELADLVRREGVTTVFTEELVSPRVAETLAREAGGIATAVLDPIESADDDAGGYVARMRSNLGALRTALGCR